jgi:hypothetical protein
MVVKTGFECKNCQRVLFDSNVIQNVDPKNPVPLLDPNNLPKAVSSD